MKTNEHLRLEPGRKWSPHELWIPAMIWMIGLMITKLLLFDMIYCAETSWSVLAEVRPYVRVILSSFILSVPMGVFRRKWVQIAVFAAADAVLLCDGPARIACVGWLLPKTVMEAVSIPVWSCSFLPLTSIAAVIVALKYRGRTSVPRLGKMQYCGYLLGWSFIAWLTA